MARPHQQRGSRTELIHCIRNQIAVTIKGMLSVEFGEPQASNRIYQVKPAAARLVARLAEQLTGTIAVRTRLISAETRQPKHGPQRRRLDPWRPGNRPPPAATPRWPPRAARAAVPPERTPAPRRGPLYLAPPRAHPATTPDRRALRHTQGPAGPRPHPTTRERSVARVNLDEGGPQPQPAVRLQRIGHGQTRSLDRSTEPALLETTADQQLPSGGIKRSAWAELRE